MSGVGTNGANGDVDVDFDVAIVGSGFSGIGTAIRLKKEGKRSFVVLEKAAGLGGTWRENHYPGCACDIPSHLYSFSFEPNPHWTRMFAPQSEILAYLERCADKYGVRQHVRFGCEVTRAVFDEATSTWRVETRDGQRLRVRHVVFGIGALSRPAYPKLPGLETFEGATFHSAEWRHDVDLDGKSVAVIGTGASAIQFVPRVVPRAGKLHLFQRTAPWVLPKPDFAISETARAVLGRAPGAQRLVRYGLYGLHEVMGVGFTVEPRILRVAAAIGRAHIQRQVKSPALRELVTPTFTPGCKRILMSDEWYPALQQPHVEVVGDRLERATPRGLVTADGRERPVDVIIHGTGFRVTDLLTPLEILGRGGVDLNDAWRSGISAYRGTSIAGYPNLHMLLGPNTGLGHNSMIFMIEAQIDYALECMRRADKRGARALDVKVSAQKAFNDRLQRRLARTVWNTGCRSWYLDANGRNTTLWPGLTVEYWLRTRRVVGRDYEELR